MIIKVDEQKNLFSSLDEIGLKNSIIKNNSVLIKVNLCRPAEPGHPRTDPNLLIKVIEYIMLCGGKCTIAESANGYLKRNLEIMGLNSIMGKYDVEVIDLDFEDVIKIEIEDEEHYVPKCFINYGVRIGIPATSKRPEMIFSNNVKLFVGAVPRRMYQIGESTTWRPRVHVNLHKSVANIYRAIQQYAPFEFFINGGVAMDEHKGEFLLKEILLSNDGLELDFYILNNIFNSHEIPGYIKKLIGERL